MSADHERARGQGSLRGDPLIAPPGSNYPAGYIYDYVCLACGSCFAAHGEDSDCWRILKSDEDLRRYDEAVEIADAIRYGRPSITVIDGEQTGVRGSLCVAEQRHGEKTASDGTPSLSLQLRR